MPLARFHMYAQGVDLWLAPTFATGDAWVARMRHLARENRMYVVGVNTVLHVDQIPAGFPNRERLVPQRFLDDHGPWVELAAPAGPPAALADHGPLRIHGRAQDLLAGDRGRTTRALLQRSGARCGACRDRRRAGLWRRSARALGLRRGARPWRNPARRNACAGARLPVMARRESFR